MRLAKAAAAYWHSVRGVQQMGVFWAGIHRACSHVPQQRASLLLGDMRSFLERAAFGDATLREAVEARELGDGKNVWGLLRNGTVGLRAAASIAIWFFAMRRS